MSFDVLKEAESWLENPNSSCDVWPEMSRVVCSLSLSCRAKGLAWIAASEDIHASAKRLPREGFKIRPDRCRVHESRLHFADQIRNCEGFDLTKSDCAHTWDCSFESKLNASVSSAQANVCNCFGSIHVSIGSLLQRPPYRSMLRRQVGKCGRGISFGPLHPRANGWGLWPTRSRSIIRCHGISISNFRIPNSVWGMGGRAGEGEGSDMACPMGGRPGRGGRRAKGKGDPWPARKRKAPQAETYGASKGNGEP
jgi:hypothetical protein